MKCPHCLENFFADWEWAYFTLKHLSQIADVEGTWRIRICKCPNKDCGKITIQLGKLKSGYERFSNGFASYDWLLVRPKAISRASLPLEVPTEFANDYKEACLTIADSAKASAALSRRCLQNLLREKAGTTKKDLAAQIQEVIDSQQLPS